MSEITNLASALGTLFGSLVAFAILVVGFWKGREWLGAAISDGGDSVTDDPTHRGFYGSTHYEHQVFVHGDGGSYAMDKDDFDRWEKDGNPGEGGVPAAGYGAAHVPDRTEYEDDRKRD